MVHTITESTLENLLRDTGRIFPDAPVPGPRGGSVDPSVTSACCNYHYRVAAAPGWFDRHGRPHFYLPPVLPGGRVHLEDPAGDGSFLDPLTRERWYYLLESHYIHWLMRVRRTR